MRVIYNGLDLGVMQTQIFSWEPVFDDTGVDYLFTRVRLIVTALVNGQVQFVTGTATNSPFMSYARGSIPAPPPTVPVGGGIGPGMRTPGGLNQLTVGIPAGQWPAGNIPTGLGITAATRLPLTAILRVANAPPLTHITIRHRLTTPRSQLFVFSGPGQESGAPPPGGVAPNPPGGPSPLGPGTTLLLASPQATAGVVPAAPCDANNGPKPLFLNITQALGDATTFVVDWGVETFVIEAVENGLPTQLVRGLLSNRFSQEQAVDEEGYTITSTQGVALFRTDVTFTPPAAPVIGGAPPTFTRRVDYVRGAMNAVGVEYGYTDFQQRVNFHAAPYLRAASVEAKHRQTIIADDLTDTIEKVLSIATNVAMIAPGLHGAVKGIGGVKDVAGKIGH